MSGEPDDVEIRQQQADDRHGIFHVNQAAFGRDFEGRLVERVLAEARPVVSLVAATPDEIVGHILFSPVMLPGYADLKLLALGPMSVMPSRQRSGIGAKLIERGLAECHRQGADGVVVLGYPEYYPRFGFAPAASFGLGCEFECPPEAFMALELLPGALAGKSGDVRYHPAFSAGG
ncbi:GNAT family N-acetyltransferase [Biformimicrobium ophioploci]|uniref:N-acetyltransferase n=1 Tax=Biformimicrobium ophioploci TaxID=3036711 RepID=A0ABQ6LUK1_9GAMM|nr:N-acetyltransferase [Microbulbifer sp. NKW57]GMG85760.1 N-acetyltransferase [Microbulbifer sp. NKW57]